MKTGKIGSMVLKSVMKETVQFLPETKRMSICPWNLKSNKRFESKANLSKY